MCGRYTLATPGEELVEAFDVGALTFDWFARYNIAPGQRAPVVAEDRRGRRMGLLTWGLVPAWMDEPRSGIVNARAESVATKPSFREAFARRRCLVPADGFYEWKREGDAKIPWWFHPPRGGVVAFAGLWESWSRPDAEPRHTFTIITTDASTDVAHVHDRMPVVVGGPDRDAWLDRASAPRRLAEILHAPPQGTFEGHPVSPRVNRTAEDDPSLIEPEDAAET
jgi:putative SOS response-associated peptidase YedK